MEHQYSKQILVEIDDLAYDLLKSCCQEVGAEKSEIIEELIYRNLSEAMIEIESMKQGYAEMGNINLEICDEFIACEDEAHADV